MRSSAPLLAVALAACVPNGPASTDAGAPAATSPTKAKAALRPQQVGSVARPTAASSPLGAGFTDSFERAGIGGDWRTTSDAWRIEGGRLCGKGVRNHPVWLARTLPDNVRIEFDAVSQSPEGDLKCEIFGDGASAATGASYTDATSYLAILGGWKNTFHVLARLNEHATDRHEMRILPGSDDERARPVAAGQAYHFKLERADGKTLVWSVGEQTMFRFTDPEPLVGPGHDHFGFNDWDVPVCFDDVKVVPL